MSGRPEAPAAAARAAGTVCRRDGPTSSNQIRGDISRPKSYRKTVATYSIKTKNAKWSGALEYVAYTFTLTCVEETRTAVKVQMNNLLFPHAAHIQ